MPQSRVERQMGLTDNVEQAVSRRKSMGLQYTVATMTVWILMDILLKNLFAQSTIKLENIQVA